MSSNRQECNNDSTSSFLFGLLLGAIIGALIAIIIYKNNKSEVLSDFQKKIQEVVGKFTNPTSSSSPKETASFLPKPPSPKTQISTQTSPPSTSSKRKTTPKMFIKPKR